MEEIVVDDITYYGIKVPVGSVSALIYFIAQYENQENLSEDELDKLPGERYDPDREYSPKYKITNEEMLDWLIENVKQNFRLDINQIYFDNQEDAMAFKLRW